MYLNSYDDDDCTASPGTIGHTACHKYPGCGCGKRSTNIEESLPKVSDMTDEELREFVRGTFLEDEENLRDFLSD